MFTELTQTGMQFVRIVNNNFLPNLYRHTKLCSFSSLNFQACRTEGFRNGLYRGFFSTVMRDLPFSFIELPLWEFLKTLVKERNDGQISSFQVRSFIFILFMNLNLHLFNLESFFLCSVSEIFMNLKSLN